MLCSLTLPEEVLEWVWGCIVCGSVNKWMQLYGGVFVLLLASPHFTLKTFFFLSKRCSKMSWKAWFRTRWRRATTLQVSWLWGRLLTWSWPAPWEGSVPWLHPSVSGSVLVFVCGWMSPSVSLQAWLAFSAYTVSMCIMQAEYLHCQRLSCQALVTLSNPETAEKAESCWQRSSLKVFLLSSPHDQ